MDPGPVVPPAQVQLHVFVGRKVLNFAVDTSSPTTACDVVRAVQNVVVELRGPNVVSDAAGP
jgi:hypothetical protein